MRSGRAAVDEIRGIRVGSEPGRCCGHLRGLVYPPARDARPGVHHLVGGAAVRWWTPSRPLYWAAQVTAGRDHLVTPGGVLSSTQAAWVRPSGSSTSSDGVTCLARAVISSYICS